MHEVLVEATPVAGHYLRWVVVSLEGLYAQQLVVVSLEWLYSQQLVVGHHTLYTTK
jgi:hypothetical protein